MGMVAPAVGVDDGRDVELVAGRDLPSPEAGTEAVGAERVRLEEEARMVAAGEPGRAPAGLGDPQDAQGGLGEEKGKEEGSGGEGELFLHVGAPPRPASRICNETPVPSGTSIRSWYRYISSGPHHIRCTARGPSRWSTLSERPPGRGISFTVSAPET